VAAYDETGHRHGYRASKRSAKDTAKIEDTAQDTAQDIPRKQNAKIAMGRLTAEIKIGPRMIDMIDRSNTHARTVEAAARQRRQSYDDG
jgi:hypothetical protein